MQRLRIKRTMARAAMTLVVMLFTTATAWAIKTEASVTYTVSYSNNSITISDGSTPTSWTASNSLNNWKGGVSHNLANGISIETNADLTVTIASANTTASTEFTFTAPTNKAITGVTFKMNNDNVAATSTSSEPGTTFTVTLAASKAFNKFVVTYGTISGTCGGSATWSLAKQNGQYTALTIGGSGAMSNYSGTGAPWGTDLTSATVGSGITSIGNNAFNGCTALTRVNVQKTDGLVTLSSSAFNGCSALAAIVAPTPALAVQYKTAANWSAHAAKMSADFGGYAFRIDGTTTADAAYALADADDLSHLAAAVIAGNNASGLTFHQTADITFTGGSDTESNYTAIGNTNRFFSGTFDGQNHVIRGIRIYQSGDRKADKYQGLFAYIANGAKVRDIILADARITGYTNSGGIVGYNSGGTIENCHVLGDVTIHAVQSGTYFHGGIVGWNSSGTVTGCTSVAALTTADGLNYCQYGGIAGYNNNNGTVKGCIYLGTTLGGTSAVGAIVGENRSTVKDCYFTDTAIRGKELSGDAHSNANSVVGYGSCTNCGPAPQDNADNSTFLALMAAHNTALTAVEHTTPLSTAVDITLQGRTLYKDGAWNTICLPFNVTIANSPLAGDGVVAMTLNTTTSGLSGTTLTLNFDTAPATIPAGTPFIIKWATKENPVTDLTAPVFTGVTIDNTDGSVTSADGYVTFKGTYDRLEWNTENNSILFLGTKNTLYWPQPAPSDPTDPNSSMLYPYLNACRAYFQLNNGLTVENVSTARMNFDGDNEVNGVKEVIASLGVNDDSWYTLNGVKLSGKPTKAGLYIHNGKKVVVK